MKMNPNESKVIMQESERLESLGIRYDHIHCSDGKAVVTVDLDTIRDIIEKRDQGETISGLFISNIGHDWVASKVDESGNHTCRGGLTECKAYRWVLGYPVGTKERRSRYAGQPDYRNQRKKKSTRVFNRLFI